MITNAHIQIHVNYDRNKENYIQITKGLFIVAKSIMLHKLFFFLSAIAVAAVIILIMLDMERTTINKGINQYKGKDAIILN